MRIIFWLAVIVVLLISSVIVIQPAPEEVTEPVPEQAAGLIDSLQKTVDKMEMKAACKEQIVLSALVAGPSRQAGEWIEAAGGIMREMDDLGNGRVQPLVNELNVMEIPASAVKRIDELNNRASDCTSPETVRDFLLAKKRLNIPVAAGDWDAVADRYARCEDAFRRNSAFAALSKALEPYDPKLTRKYANRIDHPYFKDLCSPHVCDGSHDERVHDAEHQHRDDEMKLNPAVKLELCLTACRQKDRPYSRRKLISSLAGFEDPLTKAYYTARLIEKIPSLTEIEFEALLEFTVPAGPMLEAKCWLRYLKNDDVTPEFKNKGFDRLSELTSMMEEDYPREELRAWKAVLISRENLEQGLKALEEVETESMRQFALQAIISKHLTLPDDEFAALTDKLADPSAVIISHLKRLEKVSLDKIALIETLQDLSGLVEGVEYARPKIMLIIAWARVDPLTAEEKLQWIDGDKDYIKTLSCLTKIWKDSDPDRAQKLIEDKYSQVYASIQYEPLDRASHLRGLAEAMKQLDAKRAIKMLEAAVESVI